MSLRKKTAIILGLALAVLIASLYVASETVMLASFSDLEARDTEQNVQRVLNALDEELAALNEKSSDWAIWDDTYEFIESGDPDYVKSNLGDRTFADLRLNVMLFLDSSGELVFGKAFDLAQKEEQPVPEQLLGLLFPDSLLLRHPDPESSLKGILMLPQVAMALSSRPIVTSDAEGPIRGTLITGRYLGSAEISRLAERTRTSLTMHRFGDTLAPPDFQSMAVSLSGDHPIAVRPLNSETVAGYAVVPDLYDRPVLLLRVDIPRDIYKQGQSSLDFFAGLLLGVGLLFGLMTLLLFERLVLNRVARLSRDVRSVGARGDPSARVSIDGSDELSSLAVATNRMLEALERTQQELRESHQRAMRTLGILESITDPFVAADREWRITYMNPRAKQILPAIDGQLLGKVMWDHLSEPLTQRLQQECRRAVAEQATVEFELPHPAEDGWFAVHAYPHQYGLTVYFRDISERKRLEEQLLRAHRLETAGRIASQVAHDFNNMLGPLSAYPELIKMQLPQDHPASHYCDAILEAAERMAYINEEMLTLGRRGRFEPQPTDLNWVVEQVVEEVGARPDSLKLVLALTPDLPPAGGSPTQLLRVVSNLVSNARDAMEDRGTITLRTESVTEGEPRGLHQRIPPGDYVVLSVSDTGCGIPREIQDKIFEAFFTTKDRTRRRGCGLGLSIVHAIVEDHKGYLDLESEVGSGTTFRIYLPVSRQTLAMDAGQDRPTLASGNESVLVVDDDRMQREVTRELLETLGYRVEVAASGDEAIERLRENPADLLVLDMVMESGQDGAEIYQRALSLNSSQRAILLSGFSESARVKKARSLGARIYLRKPISLEKLARAVREELDR